LHELGYQKIPNALPIVAISIALLIFFVTIKKKRNEDFNIV
jgi:hypothetical protein